jgi:hypothetical protein
LARGGELKLVAESENVEFDLSFELCSGMIQFVAEIAIPGLKSETGGTRICSGIEIGLIPIIAIPGVIAFA